MLSSKQLNITILNGLKFGTWSRVHERSQALYNEENIKRRVHFIKESALDITRFNISLEFWIVSAGNRPFGAWIDGNELVHSPFFPNHKEAVPSVLSSAATPMTSPGHNAHISTSAFDYQQFMRGC